jgi:cell division protein FtsB
MESATKAQQELERIEKQIQQLEAVAGDNQEARKNLAKLHDQVNALRQHILST